MLLISIIKYLSSFDNPRCHSSLENIAMRVDKGLRFEIIKYGFYLQFDISCTYYTSQKRSLQVYKQHCISRFAHFLSLCYLLWFSSISITERYFSFRLSLILRAFSCFSDYYTSWIYWLCPIMRQIEIYSMRIYKWLFKKIRIKWK